MIEWAAMVSNAACIDWLVEIEAQNILIMLFYICLYCSSLTLHREKLLVPTEALGGH